MTRHLMLREMIQKYSSDTVIKILWMECNPDSAGPSHKTIIVELTDGDDNNLIPVDLVRRGGEADGWVATTECN